MPYAAISFAEKFSCFTEQWQPKVIADYQFKIVRLEGDFVWHDHKAEGRGAGKWRGSE